jgi:hypothetical protein
MRPKNSYHLHVLASDVKFNQLETSPLVVPVVFSPDLSSRHFYQGRHSSVIQADPFSKWDSEGEAMTTVETSIEI